MLVFGNHYIDCHLLFDHDEKTILINHTHIVFHPGNGDIR